MRILIIIILILISTHSFSAENSIFYSLASKLLSYENVNLDSLIKENQNLRMEVSKFKSTDALKVENVPMKCPDNENDYWLQIEKSKNSVLKDLIKQEVLTTFEFYNLEHKSKYLKIDSCEVDAYSGKKNEHPFLRPSELVLLSENGMLPLKYLQTKKEVFDLGCDEGKKYLPMWNFEFKNTNVGHFATAVEKKNLNFKSIDFNKLLFYEPNADELYGAEIFYNGKISKEKSVEFRHKGFKSCSSKKYDELIFVNCNPITYVFYRGIQLFQESNIQLLGVVTIKDQKYYFVGFSGMEPDGHEYKKTAFLSLFGDVIFPNICGRPRSC